MLQKLNVDLNQLKESLRIACDWLVDIAQVKTDQLTVEKNTVGHGHKSWKGAIRGEYSAAKREWDFFCPVWHTGQAVGALIRANNVLKDCRLIDAAVAGAEFIGAERMSNMRNKHYGLIYATEDRGNVVNTSAVLECCDGLITLSRQSGNDRYWDWVIAAAEWIADKAYIDGEGLFKDAFSINTWQFVQLFPGIGRPLADDAIFLKAYKRTGKELFKEIFYAVVDRLLRDEEPSGNWICYAPCNKQAGHIHPRHAYWWGLPMIDAYLDSNESKYLECAIRAGEWYISAQRHDGGLFRRTYTDFKTDSFGHATSGIACAAILWYELWRVTNDEKWLQPMEMAINYCMMMQFTSPADKNLHGAILERVLPPDGTDRLPYHLRDLGTIFFIKAAARILGN